MPVVHHVTCPTPRDNGPSDEHDRTALRRGTMSVAAIVIARGGSIRLPGKNARPFCGHPLVAWSIVQALSSRLVDTVFLSTDDDEIEAIGRDYGARIIRRPDWPDADFASGNRAYSHAMDVIEQREGAYDSVLTILPTYPLKFPHDIDMILKMHLRVGERVLQAARMREMFVYKLVHPRRIRAVLADKAQMHYQIPGGCVAQRWEWYREMVGGLPSDLDADLDTKVAVVEDSYDRDLWFVPCRPFQCADTDVIEEFEICEMLMDYYITKGRGMAIYEEYATTHPKNAKANASWEALTNVSM